jgi:hemoglobin
MRPTLYEFAGGDEAFLKLAAAHHARCLADPELNHPFSHPDQNPRHVERLAAYWAQVMGGPPAYTQEWGGDQAFLVDMHAGNGDMSDLARRFVECFVLAADDAGLPGDPAFRAALRAYMEWAVQDVALSHPNDRDIPADLEIPRWSWDSSELAQALQAGRRSFLGGRGARGAQGRGISARVRSAPRRTPAARPVARRSRRGWPAWSAAQA